MLRANFALIRYVGTGLRTKDIYSPKAYYCTARATIMNRTLRSHNEQEPPSRRRPRVILNVILGTVGALRARNVLLLGSRG